MISKLTLIVKTYFESSWAPIDKLDWLWSLDCSNRRINIFRDHVTTIEQADGHVLASAWVTFHHLTVWLKAFLGDVINRGRVMEGLKFYLKLCKVVKSSFKSCTENWETTFLKTIKLIFPPLTKLKFVKSHFLIQPFQLRWPAGRWPLGNGFWDTEPD